MYQDKQTNKKSINLRLPSLSSPAAAVDIDFLPWDLVLFWLAFGSEENKPFLLKKLEVMKFHVFTLLYVRIVLLFIPEWYSVVLHCVDFLGLQQLSTTS